MFQTNRDAPLRGFGTPDKPFGFHDASIGGFEVPNEPYTNASDDPAKQFRWWRSRMLGGRTNHWSRIALRNGPYDFKPRSRDGLGFDWPVSYDDVAPYYDKVEMLIGVHGSNEGLENIPHSSPGVLLPPPKPRVGEILFQQRAGKIGIPVIPVHRAVLTKPLDYATVPQKLHPNNPKAQRILAADMQSRAACFWATPCERGCSIRANYQSTTVHLPPALATGNLDILPNAMARTVTQNEDGKATGVLYLDKSTGQEHRVKGRVVVLAASSCETVRLLLNSKSTRFPQGLGNSSGLVGRNIMDTVAAGLGGNIPLLENLPLMNEDGAGGIHVYAPWWLYREQKAGKLDFARGYHTELSAGRGMPGVDTFWGMEEITNGSYGRALKADARRYYGAFAFLGGRGEMLPNDKSYCELDPKVTDKWGSPVLRFHWEWSDHEIKQVVHMRNAYAEIIRAMGGQVAAPLAADAVKEISKGGELNHEVGGAMMGDDAKTSVTNRWSQCWDAKNVFIADGATFCSNSDKNPTLTIMALAWRAADYIAEGLRKRDL
jgi:choline dehydrogenase-like flavoprotein